MKIKWKDKMINMIKQLSISMMVTSTVLRIDYRLLFISTRLAPELD